ncbi:hypothetical protein SEPCBS119000_005748 [Sporothrix epigloea]|uniref:Uncharacterized protein n=1 Tax=Sporothrix epigloea TaxID=1892477 RepID=A0ABP0DZ73_9PEZI
MSSVVALTTTFTPAPSCTINIYQESFSTGLTCVVGTQVVPCNYFHLGVDSSTSDCLPSGWGTASDAYFSPGICPTGYTQACQNVTGSETVATCCPTGFECGTNSYWPWWVTNFCTYTVTSGQVLAYTSSILGEGEVVFTTTDRGDQGINAFGIQIRYQSTDFVSSSTPTSTPAPTSATAGTASATGQTTGGSGSGSSSSASPTGGSSSDNGGHSSSSSGGLSTGAKAGIGIGVALGVVAFLGIIILLFIRKRRTAAAAAASGSGEGGLEGEGAMANMNVGPSSPDPRGSGIAYTGLSTTGSPAPEQQKYYSPDSAATPPMAEAPTNSWTMPVELPADQPQRY